MELIRQLCGVLTDENIRYCHWKSNNAIDRSASGENDLDLLIDRADAQSFTTILHRLGFKEARPTLKQQLPGILDYYGFDEGSGKFVHVHAHYQLVIGHDRTKNYRLPIEEPFLASVTQGELFKLPTLEFEFIVFVIRMVLKYSTWDVILAGQSKVPRAALEELEHLQPQVDRTQITNILQQHLPNIEDELFDDLVQSIRPGCSMQRRIKASWQLQRRLQGDARRAYPFDIYLKLWRRVATGIQRRMPRGLRGKHLTNGGAMIALVGGDGAGKSTALRELDAWLSRRFDVRHVHIGRPPWSMTTYLVRGGLRLGALLARFSKRSSAFTRYAELLKPVCLARDRFHTYLEARRFATNGGIAICDRFPLPQIEVMDGPQLERLVEGVEQSPFIARLVRLETRWYRAIAPPDVLVVLRVDPEVAVARRSEEDPVPVRRRNEHMWGLDWQGTGAHIIDASRSREQVLTELKTLIWSRI